MKRSGHKPLQLFVGKILLHRFRTNRLVTHEWISGNDTVSYSFTHDGFQLDGQVDDGSGSEIAFCTKVQVVFVDEGAVQCRERNIRQPVFFLQKLLNVPIGIAVCLQTFGCAVDSNPLFKIVDELPEIAQQCFLPACHSKQNAFHFLSGHTVTDGRLLVIDTQRHRTDLIQPVVDFLCRHTLAGRTPRSPSGLRNFHLHAECRFGVLPDVQLSHYRTLSIGIRLALFQVERHLYICLIHNLFLCLQNYYIASK